MTTDELKAAAAARAEEVARWLYPEGKRDGAEWRVSGIDGEPGGDSFGINIRNKPGVFKDFASGEKGGDNFVDLYMRRHGATFPEACEALASFLGTRWDRTGTNGAHHSPRTSPRPTPPAPRPTPPKTEKTFPEYPWPAMVGNATPDLLEKIGSERKLTPEFLGWLTGKQLLGFVPYKGEMRVAFPLHDNSGRVIAAHAKVPHWTEKKGHHWIWKYLYQIPEGQNPDTYQGPGTQPLIIGSADRTKDVWGFESQWDAFSVMDRLQFHQTAGWEDMCCIFITRGSSNGALVERVATNGKVLHLWPQNDPPNPKTGKIPSEEWVDACVAAAKTCAVRRIETPAEYEDPDAWIKNGSPTPSEVMDAASAGYPARRLGLPRFQSASDWMDDRNLPPEPPQVIHGVLHQGSKLIIGGSSKGRKSFGLLDLAISVSAGAKWWGFQTTRGRVAYLNFELQEFAISRRIQWIARNKGIRPDALRSLGVMTLRGLSAPIEDMAGKITSFLMDCEPFSLIIFDPIYKLLGDRDENKVGDVMVLLNHIEKIGVETGAATAFGHHYSKGNQAAKESIDRMGGSGAFARDPDAIITMTAHQQDDCFAIEPTLRNFPPAKPFVIRWDCPVFQRDDSIEASALKQAKATTTTMAGEERQQRANDRLETAREVMAPFFAGGQVRRLHALQDDARKAGVPIKTAEHYWYALKAAKLIIPANVRNCYRAAATWTEATAASPENVDCSTPESEPAIAS